MLLKFLDCQAMETVAVPRKLEMSLIFFLIKIIAALKGSQFSLYLLLLQLVLCLVAAVKVSLYIIHCADCIFLLVL